MPTDRRYLLLAVGLPLFAALLWASYYIFVLSITPGADPSAVFVLPFLFGGGAYAIWCWSRGESAAFLALWRRPSAWVRALLMVGMQLSVLAATYLAGPVDSALLSLIGDVVLTPVLVALVLVGYRDRLRLPILWTGMGLCLLGGGLAIIGNQGLTTVHAWGYLLVVSVPVFVATYFLSSAIEIQRTPASAVVSHSMLLAGLIGLPIAIALPGGLAGIVEVAPGPLLVIATIGLTSFFVAPALYFLAIQRVGFVVPAMMMTGIPVFAAILGWAVLGIAIPTIGLIGIPIAVSGSVLALRGESEARPTTLAVPPTP